jgi:hypothetical protein
LFVKITANPISGLFHSKYGKLLPVLLLSAMLVTASAAVFELFFVNTTATVRANDITLVKGTDASASCTVYPCATESISATNDYATVAISFAKSTVNAPQPSTYYTNLTLIHDVANAHSIQSVTATVASGAANLGAITVYYCASQTNTPATNCANSLTLTSSTTSGTVYPGIDALSAGNNRFIEVVAFAAAGAANGSSTVFNLQVQWA